MYFHVRNGDGRVISAGQCRDGELSLQAAHIPTGCTIHSGYARPDDYYDSNIGAVKPLPNPAPSQWHKFDYATKQWVYDSVAEQRHNDTVAETSTREAILTNVKADAFVQKFIAMSPAQISTYIDNNMTDLASARQLLKKAFIMLLLLARKEYRD